VLIVAFSVGSLVHYVNWKKNRYDALAIEAATQYDLHPALLKAIMAARAHFKYDTSGERGEVGLLQVPLEGVTEYKKEVKNNPDFDFGWVCINKAHTRHDETIRRSLPGTCDICRSPLIRGKLYPKENVEMGAWYLSTLKSRLKTDIEKATQASINDEDLIPLVIAAYCLSETTVRSKTHDYGDPVLTPELRNSIKHVLDMYQRYKRKGLK